jgi:D-serine deaminase-like pyridoxal phosphate-dependent protein
MQVDANNPEANFIASTLLEIETITPLLKALKQNHRINILYGIPLVPSQVPRLAHLASNLGEDSISVMIDHPDQIPFLTKFSEITGFPACVFVKVDTGYHRAGLPPLSLNKNGLLEKLAEAEEAGHARFLGLYSHSSLSYSATSAEQAMGYLIGEIRGCKVALNTWLGLLPKRELVISVGATPQVASSSNLVRGMASPSPQAEELMALLRDPCPVEGAKVRIELHAGNYPVLDMQQVSTNARVGAGGLEEEIALSVVAEVCSVYNDGEREKPEALLAAGTLALGREPCPSYEGWGVLSSWRRKGDAASMSRLVVERISQEHAIVAWEDGKTRMNIPLEIGQVVKVFPNHSCVTGAFYGWYFVVDSDEDPSASTIVDVWIRGRGESTDPLLATRFQ